MRSRRLGRSLLHPSEVGLGSYLTFGDSLGPERSRECILAALEAGVTFFDTADVYADGEAERLLGRVLREAGAGDCTIGTKCFFPRADTTTRGLSRAHLVASVDRSLRNLGVERIDLFQCHRFDPQTPLAETIGTLDRLIEQGKILYWGMGRFSAEQVDDACRLASTHGFRAPVSHQTVYGLLNRDVESNVLDSTRAAGAGALVYGALGQGVLAGRYREGIPEGSRAADPGRRATMYHLEDGNVARAETAVGLAERLGTTPARLAVAWCLRRPEVTSVIVGASTPAQIRETAAAGDLALPAEACAELDGIFPPPAAARAGTRT